MSREVGETTTTRRPNFDPPKKMTDQQTDKQTNKPTNGQNISKILPILAPPWPFTQWLDTDVYVGNCRKKVYGELKEGPLL